jgi:5-formyltetrahydrofolate cyclo-ligase
MATPQSQLIPTKLALRRTAKAQRAARTAADCEQIGRSIAAVALELPRLRQARCVALYASLPDEPGTGLLRIGLRQLGIRVLLPIIPTEGGPPALEWAEDDGDLVATGPLSLPEPTGPRFGAAELAAAQVVLVPALAVDTIGTRLGRGRGYYDAALAHAHDQATILALVHDQEVLDAETTPIPREQHDVAVHGVITPTRWMFFSPGPSRG